MRVAEEVRRLISAIRALPQRRRYQLVGLVSMGVGLLLVATGPAAIDLFGIAAISVGVAAVTASLELPGAGHRSGSEAEGPRLAYAAGLFVLTLGTGLYLWSWHQPLDATLHAPRPQAGPPLRISGTSQRDARNEAEATLGRLELTPPAAPPPEAGRSESRIAVVLPLTARDCRRFETRFGGSCDDRKAALPLRPAEGLRVQAAALTRSFALRISPHDPRVMTLSHSSPPEQQAVPTAWSLRAAALPTKVTFDCVQRVALEVHAGPAEASATCTPFRSSYRLVFAYDSSRLPYLNLNAVSKLVADLSGSRFEAGVDEGTVQVDDSSQPLPGTEPTTVVMDAASGADVDVWVSTKAMQRTKLSVHTDRADEVWVGDDQEVANWLARHPEAAYFVAGIVVALLLSELLGLLARRGRR